MDTSIPDVTDRINDQKTEPRIAALKRFLDRLLSQPQQAERLDDADRDTACELGLIGARDGAACDHARLVELARAAIRAEEPVRPADQSLETMSAPPAQPAPLP